METKIKLDTKNKKILAELDMNARIPIARLARKIRLSKQGTEYRIKQLEKKGIIEWYYTALNINKLGFLYTRLVIKYQNTTIETEKKILNYFLKNKNVGWIMTIEGRYDIGMAIWVKNQNELKKIINKIIIDQGKYIEHYEVSVATKIYHLPYKILQNKREANQWILGGEIQKSGLDETDLKILSLLVVNARLSYQEMFEKLKINPKTIAYRVKKMEELGVILGYRVKINDSLLGFTYYKIFLEFADLTEERLQEFKKYLKFHERVLYITEAIGLADMEFEILVENHLELYEFLKELRSKFVGLVKNYWHILSVKTHQINYLPTLTK